MLDLGFVIALTVWAAGVGLWLTSWFRPTPDRATDALAEAIPVGLGVLALAVLGLGEIGRLDREGIKSVLIVGGVVGLRSLARLILAAIRERRETRPIRERVDLAFLGLVGATTIGTLLSSLAPVTDGDALCYHLQVPKMFLERGSVGFDPDLHETVYPLLIEMLYAVGLAFRGPVACRLISWMLGVVFALNVSALARPSLGDRAWWAGAIALLVPAVSNGMSAPLNDVALATYGTSALVAWSRFRERPSLRAAALTGMLVGLAMGVKYPALVLLGLIGLAMAPGFLSRAFYRFSMRGTGMRLAASRSSRKLAAEFVQTWVCSPDEADGLRARRRRLVHLLIFAGFAWGTGGVWYARALVHTGNPVHPFFRSAFGGSGLDEVLADEKRPMPVDPWRIASALGPLTLDPDTFDSFSHQFGPVFLLFLPALLWERPSRKLLGLVAIGYGFLAICMTQRQSMRFLLIAIGPLSVAVAWLAERWWARRTRPASALVVVLLLALGFESAVAVARVRQGFGLLIGRETEAEYLTRREPTYPVGRWVAAHLPPSARIVGQDHRGYYIPRDYTMELAHRRRTGLGSHGESAEAVADQLRVDGFTHVLFCPPSPQTPVEFDPSLGRLMASWLAARTPVYREDLSDADGVVRRYALYRLDAEVKPRGVAVVEDAGPGRLR